MKPPVITKFCPFSRSSRSYLFYEIGVPTNFAKFTLKHQYLSLFFNKVTCFDPVAILKKGPQHRRDFTEHLFYRTVTKSM